MRVLFLLFLYLAVIEINGLISMKPTNRWNMLPISFVSSLQLTKEVSDEYDFAEVTEHTATLAKPMGIVLEEIDEDDPSRGIVIAKIDPNGNTAAACKVTPLDICKGDKILEVNGEACSDLSFEDVMDKIITAPNNQVTFTLGRPVGNIAVYWQNGVGVSCKPGEYFGNVASEALFHIEYSCRSGSCGTCEQVISIDGGKPRYIRPCSAKVPKGPSMITVIPTDR